MSPGQDKRATPPALPAAVPPLLLFLRGDGPCVASMRAILCRRRDCSAVHPVAIELRCFPP
eukprot:3995436-Pyramimonas_sp.AAC.1